MAESELKVLLLEDIDTDAELTTRELRRSGLDCQTTRAQTEAQFRQALVSFEPDVILADFSMPGFDGLSALRIARVLKPETPFIFVSGTIGEDRAVESLREGATDYVLKARLSRLPAAVTRAITERTERTARKRAEEALRLTQQAIESSINPIIITGDQKDGAPIVYVNPAFERITGYTHDEVMGRNCRFLQGDDRTQQDLRKVRLALDQGHEARALLRNYRKDGSLFWNELYVTPVRRRDSRDVTHFVGVLHDVTDMKRYQEQLERQANYDALTGLANRNLLRDRLDQAIAAADRYSRSAMVLFVDLDNFKLINDTLGHMIGDALLVEVARRLSDCVRLGDTVARVAGDEFVVVLSDQGNEERGHEAIAGLQRSLGEPCEIQGNEITVTASIGAAMYPYDASDPESLVRLADVAMHRAKEMGRNSYQFYREEMTARIRHRVALEGGLRRALERGEFELYYQPQFEVTSRRVIGMEALIRWENPILGIVSPDNFIPLAEETGLIVPIGTWVLRTACAFAEDVRRDGLGEMIVAVNLSARQFRQKDLVRSVAAILADTGLDPRLLELEITESMVMHNVEEVFDTLRELQAMGVKLSVDDFGTGYSSLAYLKRFPVHRLKIDRSFVKDIGTDSDDTAIVRSIIALAHALQLEVIAEGVETAAQLDFLRKAGCEQVQGYLLSRPLTSARLRELLMQGTSPQPSA